MRLTFRLVFLFLLLAALPALARAGALTAVEGMSSTVMQQHQSSFSGLGLRVRLRSAQIADGFELLPSVEYWRNSTTVEPFGIKTARKDATLGVDAIYNVPMANWKPYVGLGFGLHFLSSEVDAPTLGLEDASDSVIKGGLSALGGASFGLSDHLSNFLELKYHHLPGFSQLKLNWGITYTLAKK